MGNSLSGASQPSSHQQEQKQKALKIKPGLSEPAFEGYVAGWRQGAPDDNDQQFSFATFQAGYEGDDEDIEQFSYESGYKDRADSRRSYLEEVRTWKKRHDSGALPSKECGMESPEEESRDSEAKELGSREREREKRIAEIADLPAAAASQKGKSGRDCAGAADRVARNGNST